MSATTVKRALLPLLGLLLTVALLLQARGLGASASAPRAVVDRSGGAGRPRHRRGARRRLPGAQVVVGTDVRGTLIRVAVEEKQAVKKGDLLAELRADDQRAAIAEARARVDEAEADIRLYEIEVGRANRLVQQKVEAQANADRAARNLDTAVARRSTGQAEVRRLEAELAKSRILSPIDGVVIAKRVHTGETVDAGAALLEIADLKRVRIEAEVDEFDAGRVLARRRGRRPGRGLRRPELEGTGGGDPRRGLGPSPEAAGSRAAAGHAGADRQGGARRADAAQARAAGGGRARGS
jgi:multidrug efflux pump subunit AcrA (membrane-fusion protein)